VSTQENNAISREQFSVVVVGHVDHGKSTVIGRLLADTGSLPEGKLAAVKAMCERNAKPFEYAFLLDALEAEQRQGITIDTARCFFKSASRDYIIIDAPGHIEFLKNMISGAARAEGAVLVIDAKEGVQENSRRHGSMLALLGIQQVLVLVNKMDLVGYSQTVFDQVVSEYRAFLDKVGVRPAGFVPASAFYGQNLVERSQELGWYTGPSMLQLIDTFAKEVDAGRKPLRFPVQDVYKFTEAGDERRIVAGRIETGTVHTGDEVIFLPSLKRARVATIESFNTRPQQIAQAGQSTGFTLQPEIYVKNGEIMAKIGEVQPLVSTRLRVNLFWMGRTPLARHKKYKLKLGTAAVPVWVEDIRSVMDASDLSSARRDQVDLHEVAEVVLETFKPIAFDPVDQIAATGRFVLVDGYEIAGGGIILGPAEGAGERLSKRIAERTQQWEHSGITAGLRAGRHNHNATLLVLTGSDGQALRRLAAGLEEKLFHEGHYVYYLGLGNSHAALNDIAGSSGQSGEGRSRDELIHHLGETAYLFTDAGTILITAVPDLDSAELTVLRELNKPHRTLTVTLGEHDLAEHESDLSVPAEAELAPSVREICRFLLASDILVDYVL